METRIQNLESTSGQSYSTAIPVLREPIPEGTVGISSYGKSQNASGVLIQDQGTNRCLSGNPAGTVVLPQFNARYSRDQPDSLRVKAEPQRLCMAENTPIPENAEELGELAIPVGLDSAGGTRVNAVRIVGIETTLEENQSLLTNGRPLLGS